MEKARISIIAAIGKNRELGKNNKLLWHIPEDMKRFRQLTNNHAVIMGRKTYESIGKPLPNRTNIIVSKRRGWTPFGCVMVDSVEKAIEVGKKYSPDEIFVIGGGQIYSQALSYTDRLYLTIVEGTYDADTFFPDYSLFKKIIKKEVKESNGYRYTFLILQ